MSGRKSFTKTGQRRAVLPISPESLGMEWWRSDGLYIDPDTDDVDWFDKRKELALIAFEAGYRKAMETRRGGRQ